MKRPQGVAHIYMDIYKYICMYVCTYSVWTETKTILGAHVNLRTSAASQQWKRLNACTSNTKTICERWAACTPSYVDCKCSTGWSLTLIDLANSAHYIACTTCVALAMYPAKSCHLPLATCYLPLLCCKRAVIICRLCLRVRSRALHVNWFLIVAIFSLVHSHKLHKRTSAAIKRVIYI